MSKERRDPWYARVLLVALRHPDRVCYATLALVVLHLVGLLPQFEAGKAIAEHAGHAVATVAALLTGER